MKNANYIVFDCETGGLDETKNPITQFACVILDGHTLKEIDRWETYVQPYADLVIEKAAIEGTMVKMSDVNRGMEVKDFVKSMTTFWEKYRMKAKNREMGRLVPVGHNVQFDIRFLNYALAWCNKPDITEWMFPNTIDTFALAKMTWDITGTEKLNLTACCERAKVTLVNAHGAMNDVEATADLLRYFVKKMRSKRGENAGDENSRPKGQDFFEFKCGAN